MDGSTTLTSEKHLKQVEKTFKAYGKKTPKDVTDKKQLPIPKETLYLLKWFYELKREDMLQYTEILSWAKLYRRELEPYEVDILIKLDNIHREIING